MDEVGWTHHLNPDGFCSRHVGDCPYTGPQGPLFSMSCDWPIEPVIGLGFCRGCLHFETTAMTYGGPTIVIANGDL